MKEKIMDILSDVTKTGTKIKASEYRKAGLYPVIDQGKEFISGYTNKKIGLANNVPYIIFGDHTCCVKYIEFPLFLGADGVKLLKVTSSNYLSKYVYYSLLYRPIKSNEYARHFKEMKNRTIKFCNLKEQQRVINSLDSVTECLIEKKKQVVELDSLIKSRFMEMFGDILTNERKWPIKRLGDVCRVINGRAYSAPELLDSGKYKVLRVGNFFTNDSWYFSDLELPADKYCEKGDLLFAWSASFGPRIWDGDKVIYHYHIWKLQDYENTLDKIFFFEELNWIVEDLKKKQHGSTMSHFTKSDMENEQLPVPPIELQTQFRSFYELIDKSRFDQGIQNA